MTDKYLTAEEAEAVRQLVKAAHRMQAEWAESSPEVKAHDLWQPLHVLAARVCEFMGGPGCALGVEP